MSKRKLVHIFVVTDDVDALVPFYRDVLGLKLERAKPGHSAWFDNCGLTVGAPKAWATKKSSSVAGSTPVTTTTSGSCRTEPGGDTWGDIDDLFRAGGETWITGSYDPDAKLTYWGTAQQKPWMPASRSLSIYDAGLFTNSTLALDVESGELDWFFQHVPAEALDLDEVFERVLIDRGDDTFSWRPPETAPAPCHF